MYYATVISRSDFLRLGKRSVQTDEHSRKTMGGDDCTVLGIFSILGGSVMFIISTVCYIIALSVGWSLAKDVYPNDQLIGTAATVITVPLYSLVAIMILYFICIYIAVCCCPTVDLESKTINSGYCCTTVTLVLFEMLAGLFEIAGAVIFIVAAAKIGDPKVLAFGISAGVFGLLAGCSCCICECFTCIGFALSGDSLTADI